MSEEPTRQSWGNADEFKFIRELGQHWRAERGYKKPRRVLLITYIETAKRRTDWWNETIQHEAIAYARDCLDQIEDC